MVDVKQKRKSPPSDLEVRANSIMIACVSCQWMRSTSVSPNYRLLGPTHHFGIDNFSVVTLHIMGVWHYGVLIRH